ncbi:hypothetical protein GLA29479_2648 [Lysobacter antibioticus]|uniref:Uncharacterized protein n=1 Tax=Lysobacter antibioticus TaxID=84531 RepID=A0A0S2F5K2_LYSAN|nr:hypothetical protein GLA29479_2648 [Lysobacter antibioticus]ALN78733.1 hypothetical protein LA76x_0572 [Lysobacter antibioticus]
MRQHRQKNVFSECSIVLHHRQRGQPPGGLHRASVHRFPPRKSGPTCEKRGEPDPLCAQESK